MSVRTIARPAIITPPRGNQHPRWPFTVNRDSPQAEGLVAWWPMIPFGSDGPLRELVQGFDAIRNGNPTFQSDPVFWWYQALDGTGDYWDVGDKSDLDGGSVSFACSCWLRNPASVSFPINKRLNSSGDGYELLLDRFGTNPDLITVRLQSGASFVADLDWNMTADGEWHLVLTVVDREADLVRLYGDGVQIDTRSIAGFGSLDNAQSFQIGARNAGNLYNGDIKDVRIYKNIVIRPAVAYQQWSPDTRWDLAYELGRVFYSIPAFGLSVVRVVDETEQISEGVVRSMALARIKGETVQVAEGTVLVRALVRRIAETMQIAEGTVRARVLTRIRDEIAQIQEGRVRSLGLARVRNETEQISEGTDKVLGMVKIVGETAQIAEGIIKALGKVQVVSEIMQVAEGFIRSLGLVRPVGETVNIGEGTVRSRVLVRIRAETVQTPEALVKASALTRSVVETAQVAEGIARTVGLFRSIAETEQIAEATAKTRGLFRIVNETAQISETVVKVVGAVIAILGDVIVATAESLFKRRSTGSLLKIRSITSLFKRRTVDRL